MAERSALTPLEEAIAAISLSMKAQRIWGMIIGGVAASLLGRPRMTRDVDVVVWLEEPKHWRSFLTKAAPHGIEPRMANASEFASRSRVLLLRHVVLSSVPKDAGILMRRFLQRLLFALVGALIASRVDAAPTSKLTYVRGGGAESCPDESVFRRAVAKRVGYDPFFPWAERTVVAELDPGFVGQVRIIAADGRLLGERKLGKFADCDELVQQMALAVSVAIDDLEAASPPTPSAPPEEPSEARAPPQPEPVEVAKEDPPPTKAPPPRPVRWQARATFGAVGSLGTAPAPSIGAALGIAATASWFSFGLEGRLDAPASSALPEGGRVATSLVYGSILPCGLVRGAVTPFACAHLSLGSLTAKAEDVSGPRTEHARWLAIGGRVGVSAALAGDWLSLYGQVDAGATLTRHRLELGGKEAYRLPGGSVSAGIGLAASFL